MKTICKFFLMALCFCAFTNKAMGQFSGGDGSESNPYIIKTATELAQLATYVNAGNENYNAKHYKMANDIELSSYQTGAGWIPIGQYAIDSNNQPFKGIFDGNGYTIKNLFINNTTRDVVGLFGCIEGTVKNLGITDVNISSYGSRSFVGGVVGYNWNGTVLNCYSTGSVSATDDSYSRGLSFVGGVVGYNKGAVSMCYSAGSVSASTNNDGSSYAGGIVGYNTNNIAVSNCYSTASVNASSTSTITTDAYYATSMSYAGGIVGSTGGIVQRCYSTGSVSASSTSTGSASSISYAGGIAGQASVHSCYSIGSVSASSTSTGSASSMSYAGGITGEGASHDLSNCAALNPSINCIGSSKYLGRVIGSRWGELSNNIAFNNMLNPNGETIWNNKGANNLDGEDISIESINADGTLENCFPPRSGWTIKAGKLPGLFGNTVDMPEHLGGGAGISDISITQTLKAHTQNGIVYVEGLIPGEQCFVFDLSGRLIYESIARDVVQSVNLSMRSGVYIVKSGNGVVKLIVR